ncbi:MAG: two-component regulator propeller domain-containing protein [Armatimonadota bacterium]|jgi:hypothetical protein
MRWCRLVIPVLAGGLLVATLVASGTREGDIARVHLTGIDVRCVAQDPQGTIWIGTARGAFVLARGDVQPRPLAAEALAGAVINDIVVQENGAVWFCTEKGVVRRVADNITAINTLEIPVHEARQGEALHELGRVVCGAAIGESVFFGTPRAIVQHFPLGGTWLARTRHVEWGVFEGAIEIELAPLRGCRQIEGDAQGTLWAVTDDGLLSANTRWRGPVGAGWWWQTGYESLGDGDDRVVVHFRQFMARPPEFRGAEDPLYGVPGAIAADASGSIRILAADGHILRSPDIPDLAAGRVWKTWSVFPVAAMAGQPRSTLRRAHALAYAGEWSAAAASRADGRAVVLLRRAPREGFAPKWVADAPTKIHDLLLTRRGRVLVATSSGLVDLAGL